MDEIIETQLQNIKSILEPLIKSKQAKYKALEELKIRIEEMRQERIKKFTDKIANTKISNAYRTKLKLVKANINIANVLCEIDETQDVYRKKIDDLLTTHGTPKKLSNLYFYFCKFGKKVLGYSEI